MAATKKLFTGKESKREEAAEKRAVSTGKMTKAVYAKGERAEGVHGKAKVKGRK